MENKLPVKSYIDAIECLLKSKAKGVDYFSIREIEPILGCDVIPVSDELFQALRELGLQYQATLCPIDIQIFTKLSDRIAELYHITHIENINSILDHGLLCKKLIEKYNLKYRDLSLTTCQERRRVKNLGNLSLHDFVPLYFAHKNPMTYLTLYDTNKEDLCFICVSNKVLSLLDVYYSDGNAAADDTKFYKLTDELESIRYLKETLQNVETARNWGGYRDLDDEIYRNKKRIRCAEVLVSNKIPVSMFKRIVVSNNNTKIKLEESVGKKIDIHVDESFFNPKWA